MRFLILAALAAASLYAAAHIKTHNCWFDENGETVCADDEPAPDCANNPSLCQ